MNFSWNAFSGSEDAVLYIKIQSWCNYGLVISLLEFGTELMLCDVALRNGLVVCCIGWFYEVILHANLQDVPSDPSSFIDWGTIDSNDLFVFAGLGLDIVLQNGASHLIVAILEVFWKYLESHFSSQSLSWFLILCMLSSKLLDFHLLI